MIFRQLLITTCVYWWTNVDNIIWICFDWNPHQFGILDTVTQFHHHWAALLKRSSRFRELNSWSSSQFKVKLFKEFLFSNFGFFRLSKKWENKDLVRPSPTKHVWNTNIILGKNVKDKQEQTRMKMIKECVYHSRMLSHVFVFCLNLSYISSIQCYSVE